MKPVKREFVIAHVGTVTLADEIYVMLRDEVESGEKSSVTTYSMIFDQALRAYFATMAEDKERRPSVEGPRKNYAFSLWLENATQADADNLFNKLIDFCNEVPGAHSLGYKVDKEPES